MKSLAYLVAFLVAIVMIGGPVALGLSFLRSSRRAVTYTRTIAAILIGIASTFVGLILILSGGAVGSLLLGLIGTTTGSIAIYRSTQQIRARMR